MAFDLSSHEVGDEFEGSPAFLGKVISAILAEGGTLDYEGSSVVLTSLPNRKAKPVAKVSPEPKKVEPVAKVSPEPKKAEPVVPAYKREVAQKSPEPASVPQAKSTPSPEPKKESEPAPKAAVADKPKTYGRPRR